MFEMFVTLQTDWDCSIRLKDGREYYYLTCRFTSEDKDKLLLETKKFLQSLEIININGPAYVEEFYDALGVAIEDLELGKEASIHKLGNLYVKYEMANFNIEKTF